MLNHFIELSTSFRNSGHSKKVIMNYIESLLLHFADLSSFSIPKICNFFLVTRIQRIRFMENCRGVLSDRGNLVGLNKLKIATDLQLRTGWFLLQEPTAVRT